MKIVAVPFQYKHKEYQSLVRIKPRGGKVNLEVTIMNGELERAFYGHHIFRINGKCIGCETSPDDGELKALHEQIKQALETQIKIIDDLLSFP